MNDKTPRDPAWCSRCIRATDGPCADHRGLDGRPVPYAGPDTYNPSPWVLEVVGGRYRGPNCAATGPESLVFLCTGYDPREGFWMQRVDGEGRTNVSERAIGRTYHRVYA